MSNARATQLVEAGVWLRLSGDHEGARRLFQQALKLDPANEKARQLLDSELGLLTPADPPLAAKDPEPEPSNPFAAPPTTTAMDLDWGSATGFSPTPIPFIPPPEARPSAPTLPNVEVVAADDFELDLPVELDIESVAPEEEVSGTLVFGKAAEPEATSSSPTMMFQQGPALVPQSEEVPWGASEGSTMQFARPTSGPISSLQPQFEPDSGSGTMQFARPGPGASSQPQFEPDSGSGTMQFARPGPEASPQPQFAPDSGSGTMQFARPDTGSGTMQFTRPSAAHTEEPKPNSGTMQFPRPAAEPLDIWDDAPVQTSSASAIFAIPSIPPVGGPPPSEPRFAPNATSAWDHRSNPGIQIIEAAPGLGAALDLVTADRPVASPPIARVNTDEVRTLVRGAKDLLNLDDHTGAIDLILKAQELAPNDPEVQALRTRSETTLEAMFESKLGKLSKAPRVKLKDDEIIWLNLDHRAGFVLAQIDGQVTFEDLFSVSGMSRLDTARILAQLIEEGVITS